MYRDLFHDGEIAVQHRLGVAADVGPMAARLIRDRMPDQHRAFFAQLPFVVLGAVDAYGRPWAAPVFGAPGFALSSGPSRLALAGQPLFGDVLGLQMSVGDKFGGLGIDLGTRRRNRVNGQVAANARSALVLSVEQSFGNCPKYIHKRVLQEGPTGDADGAGFYELRPQPGLTRTSAALVEDADTFFIASRASTLDDDRRHGIDVSHRGGHRGFVRVDGDSLLFPDFPGNRFYNTLGNIEVDGRVGLWFPDFERGGTVLLTGRAEVVWDMHQAPDFAGAERLVRVHVDASLYAPAAVPLRSTGVGEPSPVLAGTGAWGDR